MKKKKKINVTHHASQRYNERFNVSSRKEMEEEATRAFKRGNVFNDFDGEIKKYFERHFKKSSLAITFRVYNKKVFVFNKNSKRVVTVVNIPPQYEEFL